MACVILQDDSGFAKDQPRAVEHPSWSSEDLSRCETEFAEDPFFVAWGAMEVVDYEEPLRRPSSSPHKSRVSVDY
jgi:hypothetical protein